MTSRRLYCVTLFPVLWIACSKEQPKAFRQEPASAPHVAGTAAKDTARFLAGLPGRPESPYRELEKDPAWQDYSREFNSKWENVQSTQVASVRKFQREEVAPALATSGSSYVFYPFSGPDVLYLKSFFPAARISVLVGLEPVGNLPPAQSFSDGTLSEDLQGWRVGVASLYRRTFFVTSEMDRQFRGRVADGLLPMIAMLLARSGYDLEGIRFIRLNEKGVPLNEDESQQFDADGKKHRHQGVEIQYRAEGDTAPRKLYYFSTDMAKFGSNLPFQEFLKKLGRSDTFIKSASFLLHWRMCDDLRTFILENSNLILEDDTGVPYQFLKRGRWKTALYGQYSRPDRPFVKEYQPDLAQAFSEPGLAKPMGFSLGYGSGRRPSHLLLATRTPETVAIRAAPPRPAQPQPAPETPQSN